MEADVAELRVGVDCVGHLAVGGGEAGDGWGEDVVLDYAVL